MPRDHTSEVPGYVTEEFSMSRQLRNELHAVEADMSISPAWIAQQALSEITSTSGLIVCSVRV